MGVFFKLKAYLRNLHYAIDEEQGAADMEVPSSERVDACKMSALKDIFPDVRKEDIVRFAYMMTLSTSPHLQAEAMHTLSDLFGNRLVKVGVEIVADKLIDILKEDSVPTDPAAEYAMSQLLRQLASWPEASEEVARAGVWAQVQKVKQGFSDLVQQEVEDTLKIVQIHEQESMDE